VRGAPAFIDLSGGSFGFQIGVETIDRVLVFTKEDGVASAGTNVSFDSPIYSYSRIGNVRAETPPNLKDATAEAAAMPPKPPKK
jgi:hypothetical protein